MNSTEQLRTANEQAIKDTTECLKLLQDAYPSAYVYHDNDDLRKAYVNAKDCYIQSFDELKQVVELISQTTTDTLASSKGLSKGIVKLRAENEKRIVQLRKQENASSGAIGLYDDMAVQYNAKLIQCIIMLVGLSSMSWIVYVQQA